jgi:flagellar assembly factor FliW
MKFASANEPETLPVGTESAIELSVKLLGFEHLKDYLLLSNPAEAPFFWLQVANDPHLAFLVIEPCLAAPDYRPDINERDATALGLEEPQDALLFNIVTLHGPKQATVNLKGPIVVNRHTWIGKQVIPDNAADYLVRHPLPLED